ncbi:MAG: HAMP domain-containing histidine kinase [Verrucomicrobiae bacterium]|nr:HAMP domain-containing histidine kinase [Verrucomicrobiae bacterium]
MKSSGMWLSRQQMRWLVILLALMPLVPTVMMVQLMIEKAERIRDEVVEEETGVYRDQLAHLIERSAQSAKLAEMVEGIARNEDPEFSQALFDHLHQIFGDEVMLSVYRPDGKLLHIHGEEPGDHALIREIQSGAFSGWWVVVDGVVPVPEGVDLQVEAAWRRAAGVMLGVIAIAGVVWFTVHRGLRVDDLRSDLLTTVSHEMKTPLASMRVLLETLTDDSEYRVIRTEAQQQDYLGLVLKENERLSRLADDFLTFARLERGEIKLKSETCDLGEIVSKVCDELRLMIDRVGALVKNEVAPEHLARGDRDALTAVLRNLIENSLKYGEGENGAAPIIVIGSHEEPNGRLKLTVSDSGPGVPIEFRRLVFRRYFRVDPRLAGRGSGVGLGLAICRQLVRQMKGKIGIEPVGEGVRSRFFVQLRPSAISQVKIVSAAAADSQLTPNQTIA